MVTNPTHVCHAYACVCHVTLQGAIAAVVHKNSSSQQPPDASAAAAVGGREVLTMGPGAFFGERALLSQQPVARPASMVSKGQSLLLCVTRQQFEGALGHLSAITAQHSTWRGWLAGQADLLARNSPGPKFAELLAVSLGGGRGRGGVGGGSLGV
jgi:hypothetical protein